VAYKRLIQGMLPILIEPMRAPDALASQWASLGQRLAERLDKAVLYDQALADTGCQVADGWKSSGVCWRYSSYPPETPSFPALARQLRHRGFLVSNLDMPANRLLNVRDHCPNAESLGHRVINLCVDQTITRDQVKRCGEFVRNLMRAPASR